MRFKKMLIVGIAVAIAIFASQSADAGSTRRAARQQMPEGIHSLAYAALEPVGDEGWGRILVRDDDLPSGLRRTVQVWLFDLEPWSEYLVMIGETEIGIVHTRASGNGVLKLQTTGRGHDRVPLDLPATDELEEAMVFDMNDALVLQGAFSTFTKPPGGGATTYEEEISLVDVTGGEATGMAKVEMKESGAQEFTTRAAGLLADATYTVVVDTLTVAVVTTDEQGHARVHLEHPDDDNPLPPELKPVSEIVTVQWWDGDGVKVLEGSFTGAGYCDRVHGVVTSLNSDGFVLETDDGSITVRTTEETTWDDFDGREVEVGDKVKVEGCWDDEVLVADEVEYVGLDDEEDCGSVIGIVTSIDVGSFQVERGHRLINVLTTGETEWEGFDDHAFAVGDRVKADGCWDGTDFVATSVELKKGGKPPKDGAFFID
jgi:hypothetical protein